MENIKEKEIWRDIPGFEGYYQASDLGNVRSLDRTTITKNGRELFYKGRVLAGNICEKNGYRQVGLSVNGKRRNLKVSQIIAMTFLNHIPDGHKLVVDHINGDKSNDRVENLQIVTQRKNTTTCFRKNSKILSSKYVGVSWHKSSSKWASQIQYEGELVYLGCYSTEIDASNAYQKTLVKIKDNTFNPDEYKPKLSSSYKGIYFQKTSEKWVCQPYINGNHKYLGLYPTELEAYEAVQKFKKDNNIDK